MDFNEWNKWNKAKNDIVDILQKVFSEDVNPDERPKQIFHFTDINGLKGILTTRSLWATLATALNDKSEIEYGINRARTLIEKGIAHMDPLFLEDITYYLDPKHSPPESHIELKDPYVISFCARADSLLHWLHYGRSGTGYAIGFDSSTIQKDPFFLVRVIYDEKKQDEEILSLIKDVNQYLNPFRERPSKGVQSLITISEDAIATYIRLLSPRLKNPIFKSEEEWRLITHVFEVENMHKGIGVPMPLTQFRSVGGRVVPYTELKFDTLPVNEIILGASASMSPDDPALDILLKETLKGQTVKISRSSVPVRD